MATKKIFKAHCYHCIDEKKIPLEVEVPKDKERMKEFKNYIKKSEEKYGNPEVIKRMELHGCPSCGRNIIINCKQYVDFYIPQKKKEVV